MRGAMEPPPDTDSCAVCGAVDAALCNCPLCPDGCLRCQAVKHRRANRDRNELQATAAKPQPDYRGLQPLPPPLPDVDR